ncbi:AfsA-related hotdog domain-containing protein [Streptomyces sp. NPDC086554]|uniref:AfsA-related hotdog domain-containing protein n=1 Tax=Streptomyces sp. NPDC086554 TaxID=3154864 RepID=UPI00342331B3
MTVTPPGTDTTALPSGISLSYEQTVPRDIAHRRQIGEVFVVDSAQGSPEDFYLAYEVPRAHSLWSDHPGRRYDMLATAEAARQSIFVMLHRHIGVPVGLPFTLQRVALRVTDPEAYAHDGTTALQGHVHYRVASREDRGSDVVSMTLEGTIFIGGRRAMTLDADLAFMTQEDYDVFRSFQRAQKPVATAVLTDASALAPAVVGRENPKNVVIAETGETGGDSTDAPDTTRYLLAIDRTHPAFFDHEYDHVPGPLMVEGLRQAAVAAAVRSGAVSSPTAFVVGCDAAFLDFVEFEADLVLRATAGRPDADGRVPVTVDLLQFGKCVVQGRIELLANLQATRIHGE